jgi:hypothetical protein
MHAPKNSLGRFKGWDEPRSLFAIFALCQVRFPPSPAFRRCYGL